MIIDKVKGNVFATAHRHIVFGVNTEGFNDVGFAGQVARKVNRELANTGGNFLGEVLTFEGEGRIYHAIVCHSLQAEPGWTRTSKIIEVALNELAIGAEEPVAVVLMGGGMIGQMMGANVESHLGAMERCNKSVYVFSL